MSYETGLSVEEKVTSLFQPDTLLPAQYFETFRRKAHLEPERRLMLAVIEDAIIACFQKYASARDAKGKAVFRDAEGWILEDDRDWLFSFSNICEVLGFDPQYVRLGLVRWKEASLAGRPKAKIYRLTPKRRRRKSRQVETGRSGQRWLKAVGR